MNTERKPLAAKIACLDFNEDNCENNVVCLFNHKPGNCEFTRVLQKLIVAEEFYNDYTHPIWVQSDQELVCKYSEAAWQFRG